MKSNNKRFKSVESEKDFVNPFDVDLFADDDESSQKYDQKHKM